MALLAADRGVLSAVTPIRLSASRQDTLLDRALAASTPRSIARMRDDQVPGAAVVLVSRDGTRAGAGARRLAMSRRRRRSPRTHSSRSVRFPRPSPRWRSSPMREEEMIDLDRPVTTYLPWFRPPSSFEPFTVHQLLTHTAGLVRDRDDIPSSPFAAAALAERAPGARPGTRFSYSNLGYQFLSLLMQEVEGRQFPDLVRRRVLEPAGMDSSAAAITNTLRERLATGLPVLPRRPAAAPVLAGGPGHVGGARRGRCQRGRDAGRPRRPARGAADAGRRGRQCRGASSCCFARAVPAPPLGPRRAVRLRCDRRFARRARGLVEQRSHAGIPGLLHRGPRGGRGRRRADERSRERAPSGGVCAADLPGGAGARAAPAGAVARGAHLREQRRRLRGRIRRRAGRNGRSSRPTGTRCTW